MLLTMRGWERRNQKVCISPLWSWVGSGFGALHIFANGNRDERTGLELTCLSQLVCCIYRRQRAYDESSDESDSSSDDDSEDEGHNHRHGKNCGHSPMRGQKGKARDNKRSPSPNAYEKMPKPSRKKPSN